MHDAAVRSVVALVFNYSVNGLLADPDTEFWTHVFDAYEEHGPSVDAESLGLIEGASAHLMGRVAYEGMAPAMTKGEHPWAPALNAGRKVVFSSTLTAPKWANTTVAAGDTATAMAELREGEGHLLVWGGIRMWRSLIALDLVDEWRISLYPFLTDRGTSLFHDLPVSYRLELVSTRTEAGGILELHYRRRR